MWVNPYGLYFDKVKVSDLLLVSSEGKVVEGKYSIHRSAFSIFSCVHNALPDVIASAHTHPLYGKTWASTDRQLDSLTQDACAFYNDDFVLDQFAYVVFDDREGSPIADALSDNKAVFLKKPWTF